MPEVGAPKLGCADDYHVYIVNRDLRTIAAEVPWSSLNWSRVLDDASDAAVVVPDAYGGLNCNVELTEGALAPWRYGIMIERNGRQVWSGPLTGMQRPSMQGTGGEDYVTLTAHDKMAWLRKRTPFNFQDYLNQDAGTVFAGVIADAVAPDNVFGLLCPGFTTGYQMTRQIVPLDFEYVFDICLELAHSAVDFYVINDHLVVEDGFNGWFFEDPDHGKTRIALTDDPFGRYLIAMFTDSSFTTRPGYTVDGYAQANTVYVPGADSGEAGFRRYWTANDVDPLDGILEWVDVNPLYRPQEGTPISATGVFQQRADSTLALRKGPVVTIQGGALSEDAPVSIDYLLPGSIWGIDLADEGIARLLTAQRLKRIDVSVQQGEGGFIERVEPTLIPIGTDESEGG